MWAMYWLVIACFVWLVASNSSCRRAWCCAMVTRRHVKHDTCGFTVIFGYVFPTVVNVMLFLLGARRIQLVAVMFQK